MNRLPVKYILGIAIVLVAIAALVANYGKPNSSKEVVVQEPITNNISSIPDTGTMPPPPHANSQNVSCRGTIITPAEDLVKKVKVGASGEIFCLQNGTYDIGNQNIVPKDRMRFIGEFVTTGTLGEINAGTKIVGTNVRGVFYFQNPATNVLIENIDISGATGSKDETAPLSKQYGRGVNGNAGNATNLTIRNSNIHNNSNSGVGGAGENLVIERTELHHNGSESYVGCCSGGVKSSGSFTISESYVHDNTGHGIWEDVCGTNFVVMDNRVTRNTQNGIRYEHGRDCPGNAKIWRNIVTDNNLEQNPTGGGIEINSAPGANVGYNTLGNNFRAGIRIRGSRGPLTGTLIHDNIQNGDVIIGCEVPEVTCSNN